MSSLAVAAPVEIGACCGDGEAGFLDPTRVVERAQSFDVYSPFTTSSISLYVRALGAEAPLRLRLTNTLPTDPSLPAILPENVLLDVEIPVAAVPTGDSGPYLQIAAQISLDPGRYYLVLTNTATYGFTAYGWYYGGADISSGSAGASGQAFARSFLQYPFLPASSTTSGFTKYVFRIEGVPEPRAVALLALVFGLTLPFAALRR